MQAVVIREWAGNEYGELTAKVGPFEVEVRLNYRDMWTCDINTNSGFDTLYMGDQHEDQQGAIEEAERFLTEVYEALVGLVVQFEDKEVQ